MATQYISIPVLTEAELIRFFSRVQKSDTCWSWLGKTDADGYGYFNMRGYKLRAPRIAYRIAVADPQELLVCHKCDNPLCVRPDHLFLGTPANNRRDMDIKGRGAAGLRHAQYVCPERMARGERVNTARLVREQVEQIIQRLKQGEVPFRLAKEFDVESTAIYRIQHGKSWKHIPR